MISTLTLSQPVTFVWSELSAIPDPAGFAGAFAGVSNGALLVAGGANFPDNIGPWGKTPKQWYQDVFALEKPGGSWKKAGLLPRPLAYGIALTVTDGPTPGMLCIGGGDAQRHYDEVFVIQYRAGKIRVVPLASLPLSLANAAGAILNQTAYVAGGVESPTDSTAETVFLSLDLANPNARWQRLESWPGPGRMLPVAGAQAGQFYLFSGTGLHKDPTDGSIHRTYLKDAYAYDPMKKNWHRLADLPHSVVAAPSPAYAAGSSRLLVFGGDDGVLASRPVALRENHPGFSQEILSYNISEDTWTQAGRVHVAIKPDAALNPTESRWAPVTTPLVLWHDNIVLPNGEVRPGTRTNRVLTANPTPH